MRNGSRERLRNTAAARTEAPPQVIEDAVQEACARAINKCHGTSEGEVYGYLKITMLRRIKERRGDAYGRHEVPVDPDDEQLVHARGEPPAANNGADVAVLARERERELRELLRPAVEQLNERQQQIAWLHTCGARGREMASHLGTSERRVKHLKTETYGRLRDTLLEAAGGGCQDGERLVGRFWFGLASPGERAAMQLHLPSCERCMTLYGRLELMHEKLAALLPVPAAAQADHALVERALHKTTQVLVHAKQQLADAAGQAKQHAAAGYSRAVEYTPIAGARPGAAAATIAGCIALGGGAATYCLDRGVDPFGAFGRDSPPQVAAAAQAPPEKKPPAKQPPDPPQVPAAPAAPAPAAPPPAPEPPAPAPPAPPAAPAPAPAPAPPPPPPPEPTDPAVEFGEPTNQAAAPAQSAPAKPAPAPASGGGDFEGP